MQQTKIYAKTLRALCMVVLFLGFFTLSTTTFASSYDCNNGGEFPMRFAGCKPGYYYENWQNADDSLGPDEVGECIKCPRGYTCAGGFAGPQHSGVFVPYEYDGGGNTYDCGQGYFPMRFAGCRPGYYYENWQDADDSLSPDEVGECIKCPRGYTCAGGFAGPVIGGECEEYTITLNTNSGTFPVVVVVPTEYNTCNLPVYLPTPLRDGYVFAGWYDNEQLTGNAITTIPSGSTGDKVFWAKWNPEYKFTLTTTKTDSFQFYISAAGTFYVDCGDNGTLTSTTSDVTNNDTITRSNTSGVTYTCTWDNTTAHTIRFGGSATGYSSSWDSGSAAAIRFFLGSGSSDIPYDTNAKKISSISGSLGTIFPTLGSSGTLQPQFVFTFLNATNLTSIPEDLFNGVTGSRDTMFKWTFAYSGITSIPEGLFRWMTGGGDAMFGGTFNSCMNLTSIPENLFSGLNRPVNFMFGRTFEQSANISGYIPASTFSGLINAGSPSAQNLFFSTFVGTQLVTSCPAGTYQYITGYEGSNTTTEWNDRVSCTPCPVGTYYNTGAQNNNSGEPWCIPCPDGTSSVAGATSADACIPASTITFNLNNGSWPAGVVIPESYIISDPDITLAAPIRTGFTFGGWYDNEQLTGNAITTIPSGSTGDKVFWAKWNPEYKFTLTTTKTDSFQFYISAAGTFYVDCGDNGTLTSNANDITNNDTITRSDTNGATYTCAWTNSNTHTIRFGGVATGYSTSGTTAAIWFIVTQSYNDTNVKKISSISGSLGQIFGTVENPTVGSGQPRFCYTFYNASNMTGTDGDYALPQNLFDGIYGAPVSNMFEGTFSGCSRLAGSIPPDLFGRVVNNVYHGISGEPENSMFFGTFKDCSNLTGTNIPDLNYDNMNYAIPPTLFGRVVNDVYYGISDEPAEWMFTDTFSGCSSLTGSIPANLFGHVVNGVFYGISGEPAKLMFTGTFRDCSGLTGTIPPTLFGNISGTPAYWMFASTFYNCSGLTGSIPPTLFGNISDAPAEFMFNNTFSGCNGLTGFGDKTYIPGDFLNGIKDNTSVSGQVTNMFYDTQLDNICPSGTYNSTRTQFNNADKPWCTPCPDGTYSVAGATACIPASTITFNLNNGSWPDGIDVPISYTVSDPDITLAAPIRTDYIFGGWYDNEQFTGNPITTIPSGSTGDKVFWAKWSQHYTVTYVCDEDNYDDNIKVTAIGGEAFTPIINYCDKPGYSFVGWGVSDTDPLEIKTAGTEFIWEYTTDKTFTAQWEKQDYTITFNLNNGSWPLVAVVPEYYTVTDSDITFAAPIRTDYIFGGWYDNEQFTGDAVTTIPSGSTGDKVFWAKWLCPAGYFVPDGFDDMCFPHVLHVRDEKLYMKSEKSTTPSLTIKMGDNTFYANMTTTQTPMTYGSETYLKIRYDGQIYYVCDDTVYVPEE